MTFVIDASIAMCWGLPDGSHPLADATLDRLQHDEAIVPAHWWFEVRKVLLVAERRGRIDERHTVRFLSELGTLSIGVDSSPNDSAIFALARRHGLSFYDAAYLELAHRHKGLASLDPRLMAAGRAEGVPLIGDHS